MSIFENKINNHIVTLETNGYYLHFCFDFSDNQSKSFVATEIKFLTKPELLQKVSVQYEKFEMRFSDIKDFLKYLKVHMEILKTNQDHESYIFVDYNLTYQIQALSGFASSNINESYFSIRSMVNLGRISTQIILGKSLQLVSIRSKNFLIFWKRLLLIDSSNQKNQKRDHCSS